MIYPYFMLILSLYILLLGLFKILTNNKKAINYVANSFLYFKFKYLL